MAEELSSSWHSYPKLFTLGHAAIRDIFLEPVLIEEKVDGSQFSFGVFDGQIRCRSKGSTLNIDAPDKMFNAAVDVIKRLHSEGLLKEGWTYRGEYLQRPKHNTLAYNRIPTNHIIGFDINTGEEAYLTYEDKKAEFARIGLETVPIVFFGMVESPTMFRELLKTESILGGQKVEGLVAKNYVRFGIDGKVKMAKFVSEEFKEVHTGTWRENHPTNNDIIEILKAKYRTPARWAKSVQHLREAGLLTDTPKDIGPLIKEVQKDTFAECAEEIKEHLFKWAQGHIERGIIWGLPEWYKEQLLKLSFEEPSHDKA